MTKALQTLVISDDCYARYAIHMGPCSLRLESVNGSNLGRYDGFLWCEMEVS